VEVADAGGLECRRKRSLRVASLTGDRVESDVDEHAHTLIPKAFDQARELEALISDADHVMVPSVERCPGAQSTHPASGRTGARARSRNELAPAGGATVDASATAQKLAS